MDPSTINEKTIVPVGGFDVPPAVNAKCIVFTVCLALSYWLLPAHNKYVLICLCYFPYLWLSYYDVAYQAKRNMGPTYLAHFYDFAKVPNSRQIIIYKNWAPKYKTRVFWIDLAVLIGLGIASFFFVKWTPKDEHGFTASSLDDWKAAGFFLLCVVSCVWARLSLVK